MLQTRDDIRALLDRQKAEKVKAEEQLKVGM